MKFIDLAFRLGVVFAIFGFIWALIQIAFGILRGGRPMVMMEQYFWKLIQYAFLVNVTVLFCIEESIVLNQEIILAGLILLIYFSGKFQNAQLKGQLMGVQASMLGVKRFPKNPFNTTAEAVVILISLALFAYLIWQPNHAYNPISVWFFESILNIEDTPIFGFIFKVVGFFMLLGMIFRLLNGFAYLLSGAPLVQMQSSFKTSEKKEEYDDFEEMNDDPQDEDDNR